MQIVIDIPEEVKSRLCFGVTYPKDIQVMCEALNNGTPLPKGKLGINIQIDEDAYKEIKKIVADGNEMCFMQKLIANGTPLIKDKSYDQITKEAAERM